MFANVLTSKLFELQQIKHDVSGKWWCTIVSIKRLIKLRLQPQLYRRCIIINKHQTILCYLSCCQKLQ